MLVTVVELSTDGSPGWVRQGITYHCVLTEVGPPAPLFFGMGIMPSMPRQTTVHGHADGDDQDHHAGDNDDNAAGANLVKCASISTAVVTLSLALAL